MDLAGDPPPLPLLGQRQLGVEQPQLLSRLEQPALGPHALAEVEHEGDAVAPGLFQQGHADQDGDPAAVLAQILLLPRRAGAGRGQLPDLGLVQVAPFRRGHRVPAQGQVDPLVADHREEEVVGVGDVAVGVRSDDADDVGVEEAPVSQRLQRLPFDLGTVHHRTLERDNPSTV